MTRDRDKTRELLSPETRELLRRLELQARAIVSGLRCGLHRSKRKGTSNDFVHHRGYNPGDPLKHLDWKVYARTDRHYIKLFVEDSTMRLWTVVDYSGSMDAEPETRVVDGAPRPLPAKWEMAARLALALDCLAINQQDQAAMVIAGERLKIFPLSASGTHVSMLAHGLSTAPRGGTGDLTAALKLIEERAGNGAVIAIASDLSFPPATVQQAIGNLRARGHDVVLLHVMSPLEAALDLNRWIDFRCAEDPGIRRRVDVTLLKEVYRQEVEAFLADWQQFCRRQRVDFVPVRTDDDVTAVLNAYLRQRELEG